MKKFFISLAGLLLVAGGTGYLFKAELWEVAKDAITADMYISADTDSFDPGLSIGDSFPDIKALYRGQEVTDSDQFVHDKGMVFIANRSADW
ncbi:MAG: hypothetical protein ACI9JM_001939 [Halioglobus sp.]|jgi:hypothetical protein